MPLKLKSSKKIKKALAQEPRPPDSDSHHIFERHVDPPPVNPDMPLASPDMPLASPDMPPENLDMPPENLDMPPENLDMPLASPDMPEKVEDTNSVKEDESAKGDDDESQDQEKSVEKPKQPDPVLCRICHGEDEVSQLVSPCQCQGSVKWVHKNCINEWRQTQKRDGKDIVNCCTCLSPYQIKPFYKAYGRKHLQDCFLVFTVLVALESGSFFAPSLLYALFGYPVEWFFLLYTLKTCFLGYLFWDEVKRRGNNVGKAWEGLWDHLKKDSFFPKLSPVTSPFFLTRIFLLNSFGLLPYYCFSFCLFLVPLLLGLSVYNSITFTKWILSVYMHIDGDFSLNLALTQDTFLFKSMVNLGIMAYIASFVHALICYGTIVTNFLAKVKKDYGNDIENHEYLTTSSQESVKVKQA